MDKDRLQTFSIICVGLVLCAAMASIDLFVRDPIAIFRVEEVSGPTVLPKRINLNTATKEELMEVDGIGEVTAERILEYRRKMGRFTYVEELLEIKGIGAVKYDAIKNHFTV